MNKLLHFSILIFTNICFGQFTVDFNASSTSTCVGTQVSFYDLSQSNNSISAWVWDFGDGHSSTLQNTTHVYNATGFYTVILTTFSGGVSISEVKQHYMNVKPLPQPSFALSGNACTLPASISFVNVQPSAGDSYSWDFGNGESSDVANPSNIVFNTEGSFPVTLTVTNTQTGCTNSTIQVLNTNNYQASFTISSDTICSGSPVSFSNTSSSGSDFYFWDFGNGTTSTNSNPVVIFENSGNYTITMIGQNTIMGCSATSTQTITVLNSQVPSFQASSVEGCNPSIVEFTNTSDFSGTFFWDFGNGQTYQGTQPEAISYGIPFWNEPGGILNQSYDLTLTSVDQNGCSNTQLFENYFTVFNIVPFFVALPNGGCEPLEVALGDGIESGSDNYPITTWNWDFGNGTTSNDPNPTAVFMHGIYEVSVTVATDLGCEQSFSQVVSAGIEFNTLFSVNQDTICHSGSLPFTNLTNIDFDPLYSEVEFEFYFVKDTLLVPCIGENSTVPLVGHFGVLLEANYLGCVSSHIIDSAIYLKPAQAIFHTFDMYCANELPYSVDFHNESILGESGDSVQLIFDFGDGITLTLNNGDAFAADSQFIEHAFSNYGSYLVKLIAHNFETGCSDTLEHEIKIVNYAINLNPSADSICQNSALEFTFDYNSTPHFQLIEYAIFIEGNEIFQGFNDIQLTNTNFTHIFQSEGSQTISIVSSNEHGCANNTSYDIFVRPAPTTIINQSVTVGCEPLEVFFIADALSLENSIITSFSWSHLGIPTLDSGNQSQTIFYGTGTHSTSLEITDSWGCHGTIETSTVITKPNASFLFPNVVCNNTTQSVQNMSSDYDMSAWFLDNALHSQNQNPVMVFEHNASLTGSCIDHVLKLVLTDENGCVDSILHHFMVSSPNAEFDYFFNGANTNEFGAFTCPSVFANLSNNSNSCGSITTYNWSFGDGKTSLLQNPTNTYVYPGTYSATLKVTDSYGCEDFVEKLEYLFIGGPTGTAEWQSMSGVCGYNYDFAPIELNNVANIIWNMGDNTTFNETSGLSYTYSTSGIFYPSATLIDSNGCSVTYFMDTISLIPNDLNANFSVSQNEIIFGEAIEITNLSSGGFGGVISNHWQIDNDFLLNNSDSFSHTLESAGNISIVLIVEDSVGCTDTSTLFISVSPLLTVPNVFTPNGDGSNDVFRLINNPYIEYHVVILNRWGNEMANHRVVNDNYLWDGKIKTGDLASEGVYFYTIEGIQINGINRSENGFFHLVLD